MEKKCSKCGKVRSTDSFYSNNKHSDGLQSHCKNCHREYERNWNKNNIDKKRELNKKSAHKLRRTRRDYINNYQRVLRAKNKEIVLERYGKECACCGEINQGFLTMDYINNNGYKHRKKLGGGGSILYAWLIRNKFPGGYQTLCMNCNFGKRITGVCPHKEINQVAD